MSGIEPDPAAAHFARAHYGLDVSAGTLGNSQYEPSSFDAIVMLHVIEHLDDPSSAIDIVARLLQNGGYNLKPPARCRRILTVAVRRHMEQRAILVYEFAGA